MLGWAEGMGTGCLSHGPRDCERSSLEEKPAGLGDCLNDLRNQTGRQVAATVRDQAVAEIVADIDLVMHDRPQRIRTGHWLDPDRHHLWQAFDHPFDLSGIDAPPSMLELAIGPPVNHEHALGIEAGEVLAARRVVSGEGEEVPGEAKLAVGVQEA